MLYISTAVERVTSTEVLFLCVAYLKVCVLYTLYVGPAQRHQEGWPGFGQDRGECFVVAHVFSARCPSFLICVGMYMGLHTHICAHTHMCTHTHVYAHTYAHMCTAHTHTCALHIHTYMHPHSISRCHRCNFMTRNSRLLLH